MMLAADGERDVTIDEIMRLAPVIPVLVIEEGVDPVALAEALVDGRPAGDRGHAAHARRARRDARDGARGGRDRRRGDGARRGHARRSRSTPGRASSSRPA